VPEFKELAPLPFSQLAALLFGARLLIREFLSGIGSKKREIDTAAVIQTRKPKPQAKRKEAGAGGYLPVLFV
jgi:hypothetical protein